jgi:hypothetical protein
MVTTEPALLRQSSTCLRRIFYVAALCWATPEATAGSLPAGYNFVFTTNGTSGEEFTGYTQAPYTSVDVTAFYIDPKVDGSTAVADLLYYFVVEGPPNTNNNVHVPLTITSTVGYSETGAITEGNNALLTFWDAIAAVEVGAYVGSSYAGPVEYTYGVPGYINSLLGSSTTANYSPDSARNSTTVSWDYQTQAVYAIQIYAEASVYQPYPQAGQSISVHAFADPVVSFAPGFDSTGYTLEFSAGIGNSYPSATAAPEPSTLVLSSILFGTFGIVGAYRRLRRTRAAT